MSDSIYQTLSWLPQPPPDFSSLCRSALGSIDGVGSRLRSLASYSLKESQIHQLYGVIRRGAEARMSLAPLIPFRLGIVSNATIDLLLPALVVAAARQGIALECVPAGYGQVMQESLSADSAINRSGADAVLVALDYRGVPLQLAPGNAEASRASVDAAFDYVQKIRSGIRKHGKAVCILQTLAPPPETLFGNLDRALTGSWRNLSQSFKPNPEMALIEIRRVVKPGGLILLRPAFDCSRFAARGYLVRPYSDFGWKGKLTKAAAHIVDSWLFRRLYAQQIRALRSIGARLGAGPSRLHFVRLTPNYDQYWMADSDATTSFSYHELYLWFATRGDRCLNCPSEARIVAGGFSADYLVIQVR